MVPSAVAAFAKELRSRAMALQGDACLLRLRLSPSSSAVLESHQLLVVAGKTQVWSSSPGAPDFPVSLNPLCREKRGAGGGQDKDPELCPSSVQLFGTVENRSGLSVFNFIFSNTIKKRKGSMSVPVIRTNPATLLSLELQP